MAGGWGVPGTATTTTSTRTRIRTCTATAHTATATGCCSGGCRRRQQVRLEEPLRLPSRPLPPPITANGEHDKDDIDGNVNDIIDEAYHEHNNDNNDQSNTDTTENTDDTDHADHTDTVM